MTEGKIKCLGLRIREYIDSVLFWTSASSAIQVKMCGMLWAGRRSELNIETWEVSVESQQLKSWEMFASQYIRQGCFWQLQNVTSRTSPGWLRSLP